MNGRSCRDWSRIAFLHPGWITLIFLCSFLGLARGPLALVAVASYVFLFIWLWAIYRICRRVAGLPLDARSQALFGAAIVVFGGIWLASVITQRAVDIGGVVGMLLAVPLILLFLSPFWLAAKALEQAVGQTPAGFGRILGTGLLLAYYPIGVWVLRPKLRQVRAQIDG